MKDRRQWRGLRSLEPEGNSPFNKGLGGSSPFCFDHIGCNCATTSTSLAQGLDEISFHRSACAAAQSGEVEKLRRILTRNPEAVASDGSDGSSGYTPLHYAARAGKEESAQLLLKSGADVNALTLGKASPLHRAAATGQVKMCQILLDAGADGLLADSDGETALHKAAALGHAQVCKLLLDRVPSGQLLQLDRHGRTPKDRAASTAAENMFS
eukprot:gene5017-34804_t